MKNPRKTPQTDSAARRRAQRATRGVVAGYIHELSERHRPRPRQAVRDVALAGDAPMASSGGDHAA